MPTTDGVVYCDGCGAEITGAPVVQQGLDYCCSLCAEGCECDCGADDDERRAPDAPAA